MNHIPPIQGILQRQPFKRLPCGRATVAAEVGLSHQALYAGRPRTSPNGRHRRWFQCRHTITPGAGRQQRAAFSFPQLTSSRAVGLC
jgi:hypothetical protein